MNEELKCKIFKLISVKNTFTLLTFKAHVRMLLAALINN